MPVLSVLIPDSNKGLTTQIIIDRIGNIELNGNDAYEIIIVNECTKYNKGNFIHRH